MKQFGAVVVTGGSSGIGAAFIRTIRTVGSQALICNLSRSVPGKMEANSRLLHRPTDLGEPGEVTAAAEWVQERLEAGPSGPILLLNNAGYGLYGAFADGGRDEGPMIDLNVRAVVDLTARLLPVCRQRGGWIVNVSSLAAFNPLPFMATYAATKAFVLHWSLALGEELRGTGVRTLAVCPGPTESAFFRRAGFAEPPRKTSGQTAEAVVEETFRALHRGRAMVVTGWRHRLVARGSRLLSRPLAARVARKVVARLRLAELKGEKP